MNRFANVMAMAQFMASGVQAGRGGRVGAGASVGNPGFPQGMPQGYGYPGAQQGGANVGDSGCNIMPAEWRQYPPTCYPGAPYWNGPVAGVVPQAAFPTADMLATGGNAMGSNVGQYGNVAPFGGSCDLPWQFYCALQSKRKGPVCGLLPFSSGIQVPGTNVSGTDEGPETTINVPTLQAPFRINCLLIPSSIASAFVVKILINGQYQFFGNDFAPGEAFSELAENCGGGAFEADLAGALGGTSLQIVVKNITNAGVVFRGTFKGVGIVC